MQCFSSSRDAVDVTATLHDQRLSPAASGRDIVDTSDPNASIMDDNYDDDGME